ncbi:MAG: hypothetical protein U0W40_10310 [Acidimicrobiia bacterium]
MTTSHGVIDAPQGEDDDAAPADPPVDPSSPRDDTGEEGGREWWDYFERWVGVAIVAACVLFVFTQLAPRELLRNTTLAGGDSGAHVWFPAYLRDHLLPHFRLAGWAPDYYAGFPAGQFYFPFPALLIVFLDLFLPYNIAFKLVTGLGPLLLPIGAYVFARGLRAPRPTAPMLAVAATAFMFFKTGGDSTQTFDLHIMGGTLASTFAGEYSFMIALALSLCFLGTLARAVDRRGPLWLPTLLFAATLTSHLVVAIFAAVAAVIVWLTHRPKRNFTRVLAVGAVGVLLTAVWLVPVAATLKFTTDMRYEPIGIGATIPSYLDWMFMSENMWCYPLIALAIGAGIWYRRRSTLTIGALWVTTGLVFYNWEGLREILGKAPAWNLRLLPFWYLMLYLLAAVGAAEGIRLLALGAAWVIRGRDHAPVAGSTDPPAPSLDDTTPVPPGTTAVVTRAERAARTESPERAMTRVVAIALLAAIVTSFGIWRMYDRRDFLPYWAKYNYAGYEGGTDAAQTKKSFPEYLSFMDTARALPAGRMAWEPGDAIGAYGTPLALMLLPYWTDGHIDSMEGLYFEASGTTPYHFMTIATLAQTPSNPVRGLPYKSIADFDLGVRYLQLMGVRYYAAFTDQAKAAAAKNSSLTLVATVPDLDGKPPSGWNIYEVADSSLVTPLKYRPVVVDDMTAQPSWKCEGTAQPPAGTSESEFSPWECSAVPWFADPAALDRPLTDAGPEDWQRASQAKARTVTKQALPEVEVTNVKTTDSSISFDVSRTGVPVMVKASYFPNWQVEGAKGPYRATPNFMVVVPTSRHVELTYGTTSAEWAGRFLTLVGFAGLGGLVWWGMRRRRGAVADPALSGLPSGWARSARTDHTTPEGDDTGG